MTDALLFIIIVGVLALTLGVDLRALVGFLRRWKP
jgi:hypothetical protein